MACPTHFFLVLSHIPNSVSPPSTPSSSSPHIRSHPDSLKNQSRPPRDINRTKANKLQDHSKTLMSRLSEATQEEEEALKSRQMSQRSPPTHTLHCWESHKNTRLHSCNICRRPARHAHTGLVWCFSLWKPLGGSPAQLILWACPCYSLDPLSAHPSVALRIICPGIAKR